MDSKKLHAELKLTRKLLGLVNSKEEYEFLKKEEARLSSLLSSSCSNRLKGGARKVVQITKEQTKEISEKQKEAIRQIIQSRDFNLSEYRKLKTILDTRVITRQDASVFLEYCYAKVYFGKRFNNHKHKAYAECCFCKGRDNLRKIENLKTGVRKWCCGTCRINITDENVVDVPAARDRKQDLIDDEHVRAEKNGTRN